MIYNIADSCWDGIVTHPMRRRTVHYLHIPYFFLGSIAPMSNETPYLNTGHVLFWSEHSTSLDRKLMASFDWFAIFTKRFGAKLRRKKIFAKPSGWSPPSCSHMFFVVYFRGRSGRLRGAACPCRCEGRGRGKSDKAKEYEKLGEKYNGRRGNGFLFFI